MFIEWLVYDPAINDFVSCSNEQEARSLALAINGKVYVRTWSEDGNILSTVEA